MHLRSSCSLCVAGFFARTTAVNLHLNDENTDSTMLHKVAIPRKICQKMVTVGGKIMFGTIKTCLFTWDKLELNRFEKLSEAFWAT